jgi:hypothetical protein
MASYRNNHGSLNFSFQMLKGISQLEPEICPILAQGVLKMLCASGIVVLFIEKVINAGRGCEPFQEFMTEQSQVDEDEIINPIPGDGLPFSHVLYFDSGKDFIHE